MRPSDVDQISFRVGSRCVPGAIDPSGGASEGRRAYQ